MMTLAIGFALGFIGYLPPGNINLTVVQMALHDTPNRLRNFILIATVMEFLYCMGCMLGLELLMHQPFLVIVLKWAAVFVFALLGLLAFFHSEGSEQVPTISGFRRGLFGVFINPMQIPFWLAWGIYLSDRLKGELLLTSVFALVTAAGSTLVLWVYAVGGKKLIELLRLERKLMDRIIGIFLISLAVLQLFNLLREHP